MSDPNDYDLFLRRRQVARVWIAPHRNERYLLVDVGDLPAVAKDDPKKRNVLQSNRERFGAPIAVDLLNANVTGEEIGAAVRRLSRGAVHLDTV